MTKEKTNTVSTEHPWIQHARLTKIKNNEASRSVTKDREFQSERQQATALWIPYVLVGTLLTFSIVASVLALRSPPASLGQNEARFTVWYVTSAPKEDEHDLYNTVSQRINEIHLPLNISAPSIPADLLPFALAQSKGPDALIVDEATAHRLAEEHLLLTLQALSPLYRIPEAKDYFYTLDQYDHHTARIGVVIPRTTRNLQLAREFLATLQQNVF